MTVSSTTSSETFACNGVTTVFVAPFRVLEATSVQGFLITIATGESAPLVNGTDFVVTEVGEPNVRVTTTVAYSSLYRLHIKRITPRLQETDYRDNDPFPAESHEAGLDRLTHIVQEDAETLSRAMVWPDGETAPVMPSPEDRANKYWANDADGNLVFVVPLDGTVGSFGLALASRSNAIEGAAMVGYNASLAYADGTVGARLRTELLATDFAGVDPTGASDSTAGLQAFLNNGGRLRIPAGTYIVSGGGLLGVSNTHLTLDPGAVISFAAVRAPSVNSPWSNTGFCLGFKGAIGAPVNVTANAAAGQAAVTVADGSLFAPGDWVSVASSAIFENDTNTRYGEFAQVETVVGNVLNMRERLYLPYTTAANAKVRKMAFCENVHVTGGEFVGGYAGMRYHGGIVFWHCRNFSVRGTRIRRTDYISAQCYKSMNGVFEGVSFSEDSYTGGNIGVDANYGSTSITVANSFFRDLCHAVDAGGDTAIGGIARDITAVGNVAVNMTGAAFNTHPGVIGSINFSHNVVHMAVGLTSATPTGMTAIRCMGGSFTAVGNSLYNVTGHGIRHVHQTLPDTTVSTIITGNTIVASATNSADYVNNLGVLVDASVPGGYDVRSVAVSGNSISGFETGIGAYASGYSIKSCVITSNSVEQGTAATFNRGLIVRAAIGYTIGRYTITGNSVLSNVATGQGIYVLAEGTVSNGAVTGNTLIGADYAMRFDGCGGVIERGNYAVGYATAKYFDSGSQNLDLDRSASPVKVNTAASYTVAIGDADITSSVAATCTYTLPDPTKCLGRQLTLRTTTAQLCVSASANVVPLTGGSAGTDILAATAGKWATLKSNGAAWQITQAG